MHTYFVGRKSFNQKSAAPMRHFKLAQSKIKNQKYLFRRGLSFFLLSVFLLCAYKTHALENRPLVGEVTTEGNRFIKKRRILSKVKVRKNDIVIDPAFRADVDRLLESGLFDDVQVFQEDIPGSLDARGVPRVKIVFKVKERPTIRRVDFKGKLRMKKPLGEKIISKSGEPFDRFKAAQDVQSVLAVYREEGYADAKVEFYTSLNPKKNKVILTFYIVEGNQILVQSIHVEGNQAVSTRKIRKILKKKKTKRKKVFKDENLREGLDALRKYYQNKGFLQVDVGVPARVFNEDHTAVSITLNIQEERRYQVGNFSFSGATLYTDKELRKAVTLKPNKLYNQDRMEQSLQNIQDLYADKGYLRAQIIPDPITQVLDAHYGKVDVRFTIVESSAVYVDRIYVDGNTYTKEQVIRREILLKEGDVFSAGLVRRSVEKIYNLGFLDDVQIDVQQPRSPHKADLVFTVEEGKPGMLSVGAGYSSVDGLLGTMQVQHMNLFGRAQRLNLLWEFGSKKQNYEISWTDPWFMGKRMSLSVGVFDTIRRMPYKGDSYAYRRGARGFSLRVGPRVTDHFSLFHGYTFERVRIFDINPIHTEYPNPEENILSADDIKSSIVNGIVYDTRDNYFDANRGIRTVASVELAGGPVGGDVHFYKPEASSAIYIPTFWKFVFSLSARGSYVQRFAPSDDVPFSERFRMGGVDTVRGYNIGEVGEDGGRVITVFNAEYKFPLVQERGRTILQGAFFADAGGSWSRLGQMDLRIGSREDQMRSGVGFGIRFKTPVFPIRLDWGYGLNHSTGESVSQFYFTIGNIF